MLPDPGARPPRPRRRRLAAHRPDAGPGRGADPGGGQGRLPQFDARLPGHGRARGARWER